MLSELSLKPMFGECCPVLSELSLKPMLGECCPVLHKNISFRESRSVASYIAKLHLA